MRIINTSIPDIGLINIDKTKLNLANEIIKRVKPLFNELVLKQDDEVDSSDTILQDKKVKINQQKKELTLLFETYNKEKKIISLLNKVEKLVNSGLIYDSHSKNEIVIMLKVLDKTTVQTIDKYTAQVESFIKKRF